MALIAYVFRKLHTVKEVVRQMSKKSRFRRPFAKQHGKPNQTIEISTTAPLSYLWILVNGIELERVSLSFKENLRTVC